MPQPRHQQSPTIPAGHADPTSGEFGVNVDTVLLDIDGTLIDSTYTHALAWHRAFAQAGITPPLWWRIHRAIGMGGDKIVAHIAGDDTENHHGDQLREAWANEYRRLLPEVHPIPGASDTVHWLRREGFTVALASSGAQEFTNHALELLNLHPSDVDAITTSEDAGESKPAPDILAVASHRVDGAHPLVVGDSTWDAAAAHRLNIPCWGVRTGGISSHELRTAGCAQIHDTIADLPHTGLTTASNR